MIRIHSISGPLITGIIEQESQKPRAMETVFVGEKNLLGEVIGIKSDKCYIQVYEDTTGLIVGEQITLRGELLSVELGPGIMGTMFDGIQRPLKEIDNKHPIFIPAGVHIRSLDASKEWEYTAKIEENSEVFEGDVLGEIQETSLVVHKILVPSKKSVFIETGVVVEFPLKVVVNKSGTYTLTQKPFRFIDNKGQQIELGMSHKWPVKEPRPVRAKLPATTLFKTGQRVIDGFFPILLGSSIASPGPFGAGKTFTQQQVAKWSDAEIVVYVGCGERGNEMAEMVNLFPTLNDPKTGKPLLDRTVMIANTSNMPIAAREASIYTGITIAEYYRDMGYNVVLMADSTSRWAEAMREISARLGELPAEQGYPAYLSSRIASFYGRSGQAQLMNGSTGSVTVIGTVSPAGGDFSDPVVQVSLKNSEVFLGLDADLAAKRHYPAINWNNSYSLCLETIEANPKKYYSTGEEFVSNIKLSKKLLDKEAELANLVKLVGLDGLSPSDRVIMEIGRSIREDFLQQNGFDEVDTYCASDKMQLMIKIIIDLYTNSLRILEAKDDQDEVVKNLFSSEVRTLLINCKYCKSIEELEESAKKINNLIETI